MTTARLWKRRFLLSSWQTRLLLMSDAKLTLLWCGGKKKKGEAKQWKKKKKKNPPKNFTPVKFDATTSKVWHRNMLADMKYVTRLQQVEAHCRVGKHLSICGCFAEFNSSQRLYWRDSRSETILPYVRNGGFIWTNRKTIRGFKCSATCGVWQRQQMNLRWNNVALYQTWNSPRLKTPPEHEGEIKEKITNNGRNPLKKSNH